MRHADKHIAQVKALVTAIQTFSAKNSQKKAHRNQHNYFLRNGESKPRWLFSNETWQDKVAEKLALLPSRHTFIDDIRPIKIALLAGESYFLTLLPELNHVADIIVLVDIDPRMLKHNQLLFNAFAQSETRDEFMTNYFRIEANLLCDKKTSKRREFTRFNEEQLNNLLNNKSDELFFLKNDEAYARSRAALTELTTVIPCLFDLLNPSDATELRQALEACQLPYEIVLFNITNISDYDSGTDQLANNLHMHRRSYHTKPFQPVGCVFHSLDILKTQHPMHIMYSRVLPLMNLDGDYLQQTTEKLFMHFSPSLKEFRTAYNAYLKELAEIHRWDRSKLTTLIQRPIPFSFWQQPCSADTINDDLTMTVTDKEEKIDCSRR